MKRGLLIRSLILKFCMVATAASVTACSSDDARPSEVRPAGADIAGTWLGTLDVPPTPLRIVFNLERSSRGEWRGTLDSPEQGAFGLVVTHLEVVGKEVSLRIDPIDLAFAGELSDDERVLSGTLTQAGEAFPMTLEKQPGKLGYGRPQDPVAPFPYETADVTFPSEDSGVTLAGTLVWPKGEGPFTTVVLISGSGPQNRDSELLNHRPFGVLADALVRANVAVLRYDDRGVGQSTGTFEGATTVDFAADARGAVAFLASVTEYPVGSIGLIGHSEGGIVAPMAADGADAAEFLVLLAGPAVDGKTILLSQRRAIGAVQGLSEAELSADEALYRSLFDCFDEDGTMATIEACLGEVAVDAGLEEAERDAIGSALGDPWMRFFLTYDPAPLLARTEVPVLALNGSLDLQVLPDVNLPAMRTALLEAGDERSRVVELPELNHLFQHATTGSPAEYASIQETMAPEVLTLVGEWIQGVAPSPP